MFEMSVCKLVYKQTFLSVNYLPNRIFLIILFLRIGMIKTGISMDKINVMAPLVKEKTNVELGKKCSNVSLNSKAKKCRT